MISLILVTWPESLYEPGSQIPEIPGPVLGDIKVSQFPLHRELQKLHKEAANAFSTVDVLITF